MQTFEVRICVGNRWMTEHRCFDRDDAIKRGQLTAADRSFDGVKVIEESYDEAEGLFKEKVLFSYFDQHQKVTAARTAGRTAVAAAKPAAKRSKSKAATAAPRTRHIPATSDNRAWMLVAALLLSLVGNLGLGLLLGFDVSHSMQMAGRAPDRPAFADAANAKPVIYDLPTVTMSYGSAENARTIKVRLGLELNSANHINNIEDQLSKIIASVANDLSAVKDEELYERRGLMQLRRALHSGVQSAAGRTPVQGVLFKELLVF